jgi:hypothetical protein
MSRVPTALTALLLVGCSQDAPSPPAPEPIAAPMRTAPKGPQIVPLHAKRMLRGEATKAKPEREPKRAKTAAPERAPARPTEPAEPAEPAEPVP